MTKSWCAIVLAMGRPGHFGYAESSESDAQNRLRSFRQLWQFAFCGAACLATLFVPMDTPAQDKTDRPGQARVDLAWDALFTRSEGWTGGDVAGTIDLKDGRVLWVFGDTWYGKIENGKHVSGSHMVSNTAAIQRLNREMPEKAPEGLQFIVGPPANQKSESAWIVPPPIETDSKEKSWYWTTGGGITVLHSGRPVLYVFLFRVQKTSAGDGVWDFRIVGTTMAIFDDIRLPVTEWKARLIDIPHSIDARGERGPADPKWLAWGIAALSAPATDGEELMIYGVQRESKLRDDLLLAKVRPDEIEKFDQWRFYSGSDRWSDQLQDARPVAENVVKELSVERMRDGSKYVMIHSEPVLGPGIFLRQADRPEGPWSKPRLVHRVIDKDKDRRFFAYAAKGHVLLSAPDEIFVTYVVNSHELSLMFQDASIYRPRCLRVKLAP